MTGMLPIEMRKALAAIADGCWRDVKRGARGKPARLVQEWLTLHGHGVAVDGDFGPATEVAVGNFQAGERQRRTGVVDARAFQALVRPMIGATGAITPVPATLGDAVTAYAAQHLAAHPREVGGQNRGPWVRLYMSGNDGPEWPWCAGFVTFVLRQAAQALGRLMPIKGSVSCDTLVAQATRKGLFVAQSARTANQPMAGWIFLKRRTPTDWTHAGLVSGAAADAFSTVEGNTNDEGSREGFEVCARTRGFAKVDFIRID